MEKKKIYFSIGTLSSGGAERVISILSSKLIQYDYEIIIFTWKHSKVFYDIHKNVRILDIEVECNSSNMFRKALYFRTYIKKNKPDIILSFLAKLNILVLACCCFLNVKVIVCERNDPRYVPFNKIFRIIRNWIYKFAYGVLTQTESNKQYFKNKIIRDKTKVIYNPILLDEKIIGCAQSCRKEKRIVSVGRLIPQKNQEMLIRAFAKFIQKHSEYKLFIYGEGSLRGKLEDLCRDLQLEDKVYFPGVRKNIFKEIEDSEMFILTSNFEGMPNTLIEAMCIGLPCISTKVSGAVDLIENGVNGYLVNKNDYDTLSNLMVLLSEDINKRKQIGCKSSELYHRLNEQVIVSQWENYIRECINSKN